MLTRRSFVMLGWQELAGSGPTPASNINNHLTSRADPTRKFITISSVSFYVSSSHNERDTALRSWNQTTADFSHVVDI